MLKYFFPKQKDILFYKNLKEVHIHHIIFIFHYKKSPNNFSCKKHENFIWEPLYQQFRFIAISETDDIIRLCVVFLKTRGCCFIAKRGFLTCVQRTMHLANARLVSISFHIWWRIYENLQLANVWFGSNVDEVICKRRQKWVVNIKFLEW